MSFDNPILDTDSYKASHFLQYPAGTTAVSSYIESRGGAYDHTLFFGLQGFLTSTLSRRVTTADIDEADEVWAAHGLPFNRAGWERIVAVHDGRLPVRIEALPEGSIVPSRTCLVQVVNTDPALPWLTSYIETALLRAVWYPTTVATRSFAARQVILAALERTCDDPAGMIPFRLHDFGARGASSRESAAIGGAAHLVNFRGTDTVGGLLYARRYYHEPMAGFSIPAAEHSTITAWGPAGEADAFRNMLDRFAGPGKLVAVVSDSYDLHHAVAEIWGKHLKPAVLASGGTVVVRPDSGDPATIVAETLALLGDSFGFSFNRKGFKVLSPAVRVIQGDGINPISIGGILARMEADGWSAENVAFGMGGQLLQALDRDTLRFAMKASAVEQAGVWHDVFKAPATDPAKRSRGGRLAVIAVGDEPWQVETIRADALGTRDNLLRPVFDTGRILVDDDFATIRARAAQGPARSIMV